MHPIDEARELQLQQPEEKGTCPLRSHGIRQHAASSHSISARGALH